MKPLSERARNAIARLHGGSGLAARILGKAWWNLSAIEELSRCNEPAAIPFIAPVLVSGTRAQVLAAAQVIEALLSRAAAQDLASIDESMRRSWETIGAIIREPVGDFRAYVDLIDDVEYGDITKDQRSRRLKTICRL